MKAIVHTRYGPPSEALRLEEREAPVPKHNEALVRVRASSVNPADWYSITGRPFLGRMFGSGLWRPKSPLAGTDVAGTVESVGKDVKGFSPGGEVLGWRAGAFSEYVVAPESSLVAKPANLSFEEAAGAPLAGVTALQAVRTHGKVRPGQKVLVHGASGGVGTFTVQIAKALGAEVTAVCSAGKAELARSLGADRVIDYTREDFARQGTRYDLVLVVNGSRPARDYRTVLTAEGRCILLGGSVGPLIRLMLFGRLYPSVRRGIVSFFVMKPNQPDLLFLRGLLEEGRLRTVIDRSFPLSEVAAALQYLHEGHARGKIAVTV